MPTSRPVPAGIERFKIARGAVGRLGPVQWKFFAVVVAWMVGFFALLLPMLATIARAASSSDTHKTLALIGPAGLVALCVTLMVYLNLPGSLELGTDGVMIDWRDSKRYVPFAELDGASVYVVEQVAENNVIGVALALRSGDVVKVPIGGKQFGADKRAAALSARIAGGLDGYRRREDAEDASMLERGTRSAAEWLTHLRGLGAGANAGPREAVVPVDRLWRVVESPTAHAAARAGAAVALAANLDEEGKRRLRVAAESTAAPRLRITIESVAAGDDDAVAAALAEVDESRA